MRPVLSAERASSYCARIISPRSIYPRSPCLRLHRALSQRRDRVSASSFCTRQTGPPLLPAHIPQRHAFSSMADQSAQVSAQEALNAVESQCPKNTEPGKAEASGSAESKAEPALPPLSGHEFKQYNRLAEHMNYFVSWNLFSFNDLFLFGLISNSRSSTNTSVRHGTCYTPQPHPAAGQPG